MVLSPTSTAFPPDIAFTSHVKHVLSAGVSFSSKFPALFRLFVLPLPEQNVFDFKGLLAERKGRQPSNGVSWAEVVAVVAKIEGNVVMERAKERRETLAYYKRLTTNEQAYYKRVPTLPLHIPTSLAFFHAEEPPN
ncbi:hypothetical protein MIND_01114500 [Mycena indigotica]|uniref:Uncharacterized protein n=1 Tax=Mycena indigotica TaxID=2126181 RepID=A0A8H6S5T7_9AGAR|nr:uncharacterized protein MIND_01114500 [Mycena indigotica]KAF7293376.1 hypothetical protein MIND_01114500 [Mycena indigotica]